jgi:hypothetical protein
MSPRANRQRNRTLSLGHIANDLDAGGQGGHDRNPGLWVWTVHEHPEDFPMRWLARRWAAGHAIRDTSGVLMAGDLTVLRAMLAELGLTKLPRLPTDDPMIVETWM